MNHKLDGKLLRVNLFGTVYNTVFDVQRYFNGRPALQLLIDDNAAMEPFGVLTCNLPDIPLEDGEVIIKNWSENEDIAKAAIASGYFKDTGMRVSTGFVEAQIWRVL